MKVFKRKLLPILLACMLLLAAVPMAVFATAEPTVVSSEEELIAAVDAIKQGESGEITLASNMGLQINETLNIEGKSVVLNLNGSELNTVNKTVISITNGNLTVNAVDGGSVRVAGEPDYIGNTNGLGIFSVSNTADGETSTLTLNGGSYTTSASDNAIVVSSGAKAVISKAYVEGALKVLGVDNKPAGEIVINSGYFNTDVSEFAKDKWCGEVNGSWYVREKEYSDEFTKLFPDNKLVVNSVPPTNEDELYTVIESLYSEYTEEYGVDIFFTAGGFSDDYSKCEVAFIGDDGLEEIHTLDMVWNYDSTALEKAKDFIKNFPEDINFFNVTDLELINYHINSNPDSESTVDSLANYSSQLRSYLKNSNFSFDVDIRGGVDDTFVTERIGIAKLTYNGTVYYTNPYLGARGEHAICVPSSTGNTPQELLAAAQKRVDDYIGKGKVTITLGEKTVTEYYNDTLAEYDAAIAAAQQTINTAQAAIDALDENDPQNLEQISNYRIAIMYAQIAINSQTGYKQYFTESFREDGDLYFLNSAEGGYLFDVKIGEETYQFIVIKDDTKLAVPTYASVDLSTSVEVKTDSSEVPLDTAVEVEKLTSGEEYSRIIKAIGTESGEMFEIKLYSSSLDKYITKLENGKFEVKLPVPEKFQNKTLAVYYVDADNKVTEHQVTVKDGFASFVTDHFSIYTLAEKATTTAEETKQEDTKNTETETETKTEPLPKAGDNSQIALWIALAFVSACLLFSTKTVLKKSRKN
ncbi:MAG: hypothetical protein UHO61_02725 [Acutalibacteraceae bacterium]|nr:hypothetical protein [Acutalibacteraceae bacterium]